MKKKGSGSRESLAMSIRAAALLAMLALPAGCASLIAGAKQPTTIYAPDTRVPVSPEWPQVRWKLALGRPSGARTADGLRIMVRPTPNEVQVYKGAQWAKSPGDMLEDSVLHALEDSGRIAVVARQGSGFSADFRLLLDVRRFEADYAGAAVPAATIEVTAKLLYVKDQALAGSRTFVRTQSATTTAVPDVVAAFDQALADASGEIVGWTLATGEQHERSRH
ncbi:ABC-type transport auxiliary lipoprotein family protein [Lysobacter niabensis]